MNNYKSKYFIFLFFFFAFKLNAQRLPVQPDYLQYSIKLYKPILNYEKAKPDFIVNASARAFALYTATKDEKYLKDCKNNMAFIFDQWASDPSAMSKYSIFFNLYQVCFSYEGLKQTGNLNIAWDQQMIDYITMFNTHAMGDNNQVYARAAGLAYAIKLFPLHPQATDISNYITKAWNQWYPNKDVNENAMHYCGIGMRDVIRIAKLTNREDLLNNSEIKKWIFRYRDILNPSGTMPEVGDDYFFSEWNPWLFNFEYFATVFDEPTLIEAAWRLFANGSRNQAEEFYETELITSQVKNIIPEKPTTNSIITKRTINGVTGILDKMILTPSRFSGDPLTNLELYGRGSHGHPNRIGAVQYYEVGNVPLFHNMMRRQTDARFGNLIAVLPDSDPLPVPVNNTSTNSGISATNIWYEQACETNKLLLVKNSSQSNSRRILDVSLRLSTQNTGKDILVTVDNFRLESADGKKSIPLEMCETLENWKRRDNPYSLVTDNIQGNNAVQIRVVKGEPNLIYGFRFSTENAVNFDCTEYPVLKFNWKQTAENMQQTNIWFIARFENVDFNVGSVDKEATVTNAFTETQGKDNYGKVELKDYRFTGTSVTSKLVRHQILTSEGVLVLFDELTPDANATHYYAASLWHMYSKGESGTNWFDSPGETSRTYFDPETGSEVKKSLLVYYNQKKGRTFSSNLYEVGGAERYSTYAKQSLKPNQIVKFITVLVPHSVEQSPKDIASKIVIQSLTNETTVSIPYPYSLVISKNLNGNWKVDRTQNHN